MIEELDELMYLLPEDQIDRVFNQEMVDIDGTFLGFTKIYKNLSEMIPKHFTIVDLGCGYNSQSYYFKDHKEYIAVDAFAGEVFMTDNCKIFKTTISKFIQENLSSLNLDETFAICSYVPPWGDDNIKLTRESFINVFTYYPHGGYKEIVFKR